MAAASWKAVRLLLGEGGGPAADVDADVSLRASVSIGALRSDAPDAAREAELPLWTGGL